MNHIAVMTMAVIAAVSGIAYGESPKSTGASHAIEQYTLNEGTTWMFGTSSNISRSNIGEAVINIVTSAASPYIMMQGFLYYTLWEPPLPDYQYDIDVVHAFTFAGGNPIPERTWFADADPQFTWAIKTTGLPVAGYSLAFDAMPDDIIDVTTAEYQTPDFYLSEGKHLFYVMAKNTGGGFGLPGSFEIWVDVTAPTITNTLPLNGRTINEARPTIQGMLADATSGIDAATIVITITTTLDTTTVTGTYDAATGLVVYVPPDDLPNGLVTVRMEVSDGAGNPAVPVLWSFTVDTSQPGGWIRINNDEPVVTGREVALKLFSQDIITPVTQMMIANDAAFTGAAWESYAEEKAAWLLTPGAGVKTVYVKFRDSGGNESEIYSDSILLKLELPNTFITGSPLSITPDTTATFTYTATIAGSQFQYKVDNEDWSAWSDMASATLSGLANGNHYFQVRAGLDLNVNGAIDPDEIDLSPAVASWTVGTLSTTALETKQPIRYYKHE